MKSYGESQLNNLRQSGRIMRGIFALLEKEICAGVNTLELDRIAEQYIRDNGAEPSFKGYDGYRFTLCTSINEESIHGIPRKNKILRDGDIISIDCGVRYPAGKGGMCTDAARTYAVGEISKEARDLIKTCEQSFHAAAKDLRAGDKISKIGEKIDTFIDGRYGILEKYVSHGVGEKVHQEPHMIPNYDVRKSTKNRAKMIEMTEARFVEGAVIAIEPMINLGTHDVRVLGDGWTVVTADGSLAAHYENTVIIQKHGIEIVT